MTGTRNTKLNDVLCKRMLFFLSIYVIIFMLIILKIDLRDLMVHDNLHKASLDDYLHGEIIKGEQLNENKPTLTAYLETVDQEEWEIMPLPQRKNARASMLEKVEFTRLNSCRDLTSQWPVDDYRDDDPFLPWIHDVFPSPDGSVIHFIAENKRRCHTGQKTETLRNLSKHMQPQVSLFQHVPMKRVNDTHYRLASHEEADPDGMQTRFICRFKPTMQETLSTFHVDYEYATYRKRFINQRVMFNKENTDYNNVWNAQLMFNCPVPNNLQQIVASGESVINDYASIFIDLIPIRTPPRYNRVDEFLLPQYGVPNTFDANSHFGKHHILPPIEDSGRWENIPICKPSLQTFNNTKNHTLVAFTWTSNSYKTRKGFAVPDGERRLTEWITFHLLVGFDHIYVYDNTKAFDTNSSLQHVIDKFPANKVTLINWPAKVCNNNPNNVDDRGERSSQYAAEASCLLRFGYYHAKWMTTLDIDEYLVPIDTKKTIKDILNQVEKEGVKIYSFKSFRTRPILKRFEAPIMTKCFSRSNAKQCFLPTVPMNSSFLYTYNCEHEKPPKTRTVPAEKEIFRTDYVKLHFIHYSAITSDMLQTKTNVLDANQKWDERHFEQHLRFADEVTEATMIHTKTVPFDDTRNYQEICKQKKHYFGFPWPNNVEDNVNNNKDEDGYYYNCFINDAVEKYWIPKLHEALGLPVN